MLVAALRLALRRLARRPGTTALHVGGLAVGLACCFLAVLYVRDERSFDRFHEGADRIYQLHEERSFGDQSVTIMSTDADGVELLRRGVPGVEAVAVLGERGGAASVRRAEGGSAVDLEEVGFAEPSFFDVFTFPLVRGNPETALAGPGRAVVTASTARRLFGDGDPMGQQILVDRTGSVASTPPLTLEVAGVAADPPSNSSIQFDLLVSGETAIAGYDGTPAPALANGGATYVRLRAAGDTTAVQTAMARLARSRETAAGAFGTFDRAGTTPLTSTHMAWRGAGATGMSGQPLYLILFSAVAALVLLLACINYANLATALALRRGMEVGVRKAVGAGRGQLTRQFLLEALLLACTAGAVAAGLVFAVLPAFNSFFGKGVSLAGLEPSLMAAGLGLTVLTGLLAGIYPAFVLARFQPVTALKRLAVQGRAGTRLRQGLVVVQFAVTVVLLAGTAVVGQQLRYARTGDLGFDGDQSLVIDLDTPGLAAQRDVLERAMEALPSVRRASVASSVPGDDGMLFALSPENTADDPSDDIHAMFAEADGDFSDALGLHLVAGRWLPQDAAATAEGERFGGPIVLNETAARRLGLMTNDPQAAVGQRIDHFEVVGVVRDFNYRGLRAEIGPFAFIPMSESAIRARLVVQLDRADLPGGLAAVREAWATAAPTYPFEAHFVDDRFAEQMREDRQLGQLFGAFGGVAVVLACLGMFGLAAYAAERRTKEIGVRKVLGAGVAGLIGLLSAEFVRLVLVALVVAAPVTALLAQRWLEGFTFRAPLSPTPFVLIGLGVLGLALLTVSVHAVRAALADPVRSLRSE